MRKAIVTLFYDLTLLFYQPRPQKDWINKLLEKILIQSTNSIWSRLPTWINRISKEFLKTFWLNTHLIVKTNTINSLNTPFGFLGLIDINEAYCKNKMFQMKKAYYVYPTVLILKEQESLKEIQLNSYRLFVVKRFFQFWNF